MLTPGISVKAITFRRDGFRKFENMNRKKTKNLLVLLVLSSACVAGYLVFYRHEPQGRETMGGVKNMHIHSKGKLAGHRSRVGGLKSSLRKDDSDRVEAGGNIGMKLYAQGVDKAAFAKGEARDWIKNHHDDGYKSEAERRLAERLKSRLEEQQMDQVGEGDEDDAGDLANVEKEENIEEAEVVDEDREEGEEELEAEEEEPIGEVEKPAEEEETYADEEVADQEDPHMGDAEAERNQAVLNLQERLKARLDERKDSDTGNIVDISERKELAPNGQDLGDNPLEDVEEDKNLIMPFDERAFNRAPKADSKPKSFARIAPYGEYGEDAPKDNRFQDFGKPANNQPFKQLNNFADKKPLRSWERPAPEEPMQEEEEEVPMQMPNQLQQFGDADRVKQHLADLNGENEPQQYQGPGFYNKNRALEQGNKMGGMDAFVAKKKPLNSAFNKPKHSFESAFGSAVKGGNEKLNPFGARKPGEPLGGFNNNPFMENKKDDAFGAFRGHGNVGNDGLGQMPNNNVMQNAAPAAPAEEEAEDEFENRFIDNRGLLKGGAGHAPLRPFGGAGMNPFRDKNFKNENVRRKSNLLVPESQKVHFDLRDPAGVKPQGLLLDDDDDSMAAPNQPGLPPDVPEDEHEPNQFGEIPVAAPKMNQFGEIPVAAPKQAGAALNPFGAAPKMNQFGEIPVANPRVGGAANQIGGLPDMAPQDNMAEEQQEVDGGSMGGISGISVRDVSKRFDAGKECVTYTYPSTSIAAAKMCLHGEGSDLVSDTIREDGSWEPLLMRQLVTILGATENWNLNLIDIGAGIGVFTMCAALLHRNVLAVEPNPANYLLLHQNAYENLVGSKITLVTQALDNSSYVGQLSATKTDGGYSGTHVNKVMPGMSLDTKRQVNVTTLDALLDVVNFEKAVMKIDVTDNKVYNILSKGSEFFKTVQVKYILTHWKKSSAVTEHVRLMTLMAQLGYAPHRTWDGPTLQLAHLTLDQTFLVWKRPTLAGLGLE